MADYYEERWPESYEALRLAKSGDVEAGIALLERYLQEQRGKLSWGLYHATFDLEILKQLDSEADWMTPESERLFEQLVPEHITKQELARRLKAETANFLKLYADGRASPLPEHCVYLIAMTTTEYGRDFRDNLRAFTEDEFLDFVWLPDGYTKWVDMRLLEADDDFTYIVATVGGRVETFRDVYHHDEGEAPFRTM